MGSSVRQTPSVAWFHDQRMSKASSASESNPSISVGRRLYIGWLTRVCLLIVSPYNYVLRCQSRIQSGANEDQDGRGQQYNRIVATQTEGARAANKHVSAQGIHDVGQRIEM